MPRTIIESFAVGTPVIASNQGSMADLISHGVNGLHFLTGDSEDLTRQIDWLTTHPQELNVMRAAARADFEAKYGASRNLELLLEIYRQATLQHGRKP
jgi:glycosyltransferase involved in cell wall biosynthesis